MPVPPSSGQTITDQVFFRLGGRVPTTLLIDYVNKALSTISGAASYVWDVKTALVVIPTNTLELSTFDADIDIGSDISITNANGIPIQRVDENDLLSSQAAQYVGINPLMFNNWYIAQSSVAAPGKIVFTPTLLNTTILITYNVLPPVLTYGGSPLLRWTQQWMDDLLIDGAEFEVKRIMNFEGWQALEQRFIAKLQDARVVFSSQRKDTGTLEEAQVGATGV